MLPVGTAVISLPKAAPEKAVTKVKAAIIVRNRLNDKLTELRRVVITDGNEACISCSPMMFILLTIVLFEPREFYPLPVLAEKQTILTLNLT